MENLKAAAAGELEETSVLYPEAARIAREEGFEAVAIVFENIGKVEKFHEQRYLALAANIANGTVFKKAKETVWKCRNCGYNHTGTEAPDCCPACAHPKAYFQVREENW